MRIPILFFLLVASLQLLATHNRAGDITFVRLPNKTIEVTVSTFTKASSIPADRDSVLVCWGDGHCNYIVRSNGVVNDGVGSGEDLPLDNQFNAYTGTHSYLDYGDYVITMEDPNRNQNIINIDPLNSDNIPFFLKNEFTLMPIFDDSPMLLEMPIDYAFVGEVFYHTPNAYDADGDSLAYRLTTPLGSGGQPIMNYMPLDDFGNSSLTLDEATGLLTWDSPPFVGEYVVAIEVLSFRDGMQIGSLVRDMTIIVSDLMNALPDLAMTQFMPNDYTTVEVGQTVQFLVVCEDVQNENGLDLTVTSGLFDPDFSTSPVFTIFFENDVASEANFLWEVSAEQVRDQPYQVVFKAADELGLAHYVVLRFKVVDMPTDAPQLPAPDPVILFPNPSDGYLFVNSEALFGQTYEIWNEVGQVVGKGRVTFDGGIDVVGIRNGMFVVRFKNGSACRFVRN